MFTTRLATFAIVQVFALIAIVVGWQLTSGLSAIRIMLCAALTCPLWAPLRGLMKRDRKTYAWATLCVIPYFILGVTESVANPHGRLWSGLSLIVALALFVTLILYLRVTNPARAAPLAE